MKEKQAFIFFIGKRQHDWERNREISNLYMNKVAIDEENQIKVFSVEEVKIDKDLTRERISSELGFQISLILLKRIHRDIAGMKFPNLISTFSRRYFSSKDMRHIICHR